jgi:hypothetical protein
MVPAHTWREVEYGVRSYETSPKVFRQLTKEDGWSVVLAARII